MNEVGEQTLFLAPCINEEAQSHFRSTVLNPVVSDIYSDTTDKDLGDEVYLWVTGEGGERHWNQLRPGDILLFYSEQGVYSHSAQVIDTEINPELGDTVFDALEEDFHNIIYLREPTEISISSAELHRKLGYNRDYPINFSGVGDERLDQLRNQFGSIRGFIDEVSDLGPGAPDEDLKEAIDELEEATNTEPPLTEDLVTKQTHRVRARSAAFCREVLSQYDRQCAICGASRESPSGNPEVKAVHIYPRSENGVNDIRNGIALCKLHDWAFTVGWISLSNSFEIMVKEAPDRDGYQKFQALSDASIMVPDQRQFQPHPKFIEKHRDLHGFEHS